MTWYAFWPTTCWQCTSSDAVGPAVAIVATAIAVRAEVRGVRSMCNQCNLTFFSGGWQKIVAQIRGFFRKIIINYPHGGQIFAPKPIFTPIFRIHTGTTGSGYLLFGYFLRLFHVLIEIYRLVPFPPSVLEGVSDYTRASLRWRPVTSARAG